MIGTCDRAADAATDVQPVHVGQAEVEQDDVRLVRLERRGAGRRPLDLEPLAPQALRERLGDRVLRPRRSALACAHLDRTGRGVSGSPGGIFAVRRQTFTGVGPSPRSGPPTVGASTGRSQMNKAHAAGIALLLAAAAVLGMVAATRTAGLGRAARVGVRRSRRDQLGVHLAGAPARPHRDRAAAVAAAPAPQAAGPPGGSSPGPRPSGRPGGGRGSSAARRLPAPTADRRRQPPRSRRRPRIRRRQRRGRR